MHRYRRLSSLLIVSSFLFIGCQSEPRVASSSSLPSANVSSSVSSSDTVAPSKSDIVAQRKKAIPNNFKSVSVLGQVIYVPNDIKILYSISNPTTNVGMAFTGTVWEKSHESKDPLADHYDVAVMFEKNSVLKQMQPFEEDEVLEVIFKNTWETMERTSKVATKHKLISKEICTTFDGHKYLKFVSVDGNPSKPQIDRLDKSGIYIFGDTVYYVSLGQMVRANGKYSKTFDLILDSFGVR